MGAHSLSISFCVFQINRNEEAIKYYKPLPVNRIMIAFCRWNKYSYLWHTHTKKNLSFSCHREINVTKFYDLEMRVLRIECMLHRSAPNS